jgi:hypothetical protein
MKYNSRRRVCSRRLRFLRTPMQTDQPFIAVRRLAAVLLVLSTGPVFGQTLLLSRTGGTVPVGAADRDRQFLTDAFRPGAEGETWVIERIRVWGMPDGRGSLARSPGDLFESIILRGGLWSDPPASGTPDCGCHGLLSLAAASLEPGTLRTSNPDVTIAIGDGSWQIDFNNLAWSVPGGSRVQFGVEAKSRVGDVHTWYARGSRSSEASMLHLFTSDGKPAGAFEKGGGLLMDVQVWAHRLAAVSIARSRGNYEVIVKGQQKFASSDIDPATLEFGAGGSRPERVRIMDADGDGIPDLAGTFSSQAAAIPRGSVTACIKGRLRNGHAFEGCDLVGR